jgi:glycosyltransferase involved in cell wall biosynthesis
MHYAMRVYQTLERLHAERPFDVIEFPDTLGPGAFALRARRTLGKLAPAVLAVRLHLPSHERRQLNRLALLDMEGACVEYQEAVALREADLLLSPTRDLLERVGTRLGLQQPSAVLPSPLPLALQGLPQETSARTGRARILFFGRLEYRRGLHLLVEAVHTLLSKQLDVECLFVGDDTPTGPAGQSLRAWLERRIPERWRERFRFEPARPLATLLPELRSASVCCFPSLGEGAPDTCQEALAAGAVVVASDAGGLGALLEEGRSGLLFPSGDVGQLAATLERALTEEPLRQTLREAAPRRAADCCAPERFVEQFERAVQRVAEARRSEPAASPRPKARASRPDVSILVPYYNMGRYLPETLRSLWAQTFQDYEILLVDDGSTDPESRRLLDTLEDSRLRVIRKQNGGLSSARNAGLREARGRWILPVDPDDLLAPTFLEKAVDVMGRTPGLGYVTSLVAYFTDNPAQPVGGWVPWGMERESLWLENVASTCTALMERERVLAVGGYDEWLTSFEDWDVFCGLAERGYEGTVIPEFLFFYRQRPDSMTRTEATRSRQGLIAYLVQKHPTLARAPERALRIQLGEVQRLQEQVRQLSDKPLRYQLADRVNDAVKRFRFAHETLRQASQRLRRPW